MVKIDTVIFDLGAVLIRWDPYPVLLKAYNNDESKTRWFLEKICSIEWNGIMDAGKSFEAAKRERCAEYPEHAKYISIYIDDWEKMLLGEIPGTVKILEQLKNSGTYKLFAITNWSAEKFPIARAKYPFLDWFEDIVVSGEIGVIKPDRKIYEYSIKRFKLTNPETSVFIDDREENLSAAAEFGINGILFKNPEQLENDLRKMGIGLNTNHQRIHSS